MVDRFADEYAFLSNFYPWDPQLKRYIAPSLDILLYGDLYPTVEHAFQAAKTLPSEQAVRKVIHDAQSPGQAKLQGRRVRLRSDWDAFRLVAMEELLRRKFADPELRAKLLDTWPHELVEGNTWDDDFWGAVRRNGSWVGQNHLGRLLMRIRDDARSQ